LLANFYVFVDLLADETQGFWFSASLLQFLLSS
jgi:hypothetical protein